MSDKHIETFAEVMQKIRDSGFGELADHIEAALKRELLTKPAENVNSAPASDTAGNSAKLREALEHCRNCAQMIPSFVQASRPERYSLNAAAGYANLIIEEVNAALAAPPRNCDVGTAEEQEDRFNKYCRGSNYCAVCPIRKLWDFQDGHSPSGREARNERKRQRQMPR